MSDHQTNWSMDDSFFTEAYARGSSSDTVEEYFRRYDERVNAKIAAGLKRAIQLIVVQLNGFIDK